MYCTFCGCQNDDNAERCQNCGNFLNKPAQQCPQQPVNMNGVPQTNPPQDNQWMAVVSLIAAIASFLGFGPIGSIVSLVLVKLYKKSGNTKDLGMIKAAKILSIVSLVLFGIFILIWIAVFGLSIGFAIMEPTVISPAVNATRYINAFCV